MRRKICWPNPDATCLEGGCSWCEIDGEIKTEKQLVEYINNVVEVQNRGNSNYVNSKEALEWGIRHNRNNIWKGEM